LPEPDVRKQNWSAAKQVYQFFVDKKEEYIARSSQAAYTTMLQEAYVVERVTYYICLQMMKLKTRNSISNENCGWHIIFTGFMSMPRAVLRWCLGAQLACWHANR